MSQQFINPPEVITVTEICKITNLSRRTAIRHIKAHHFGTWRPPLVFKDGTTMGQYEVIKQEFYNKINQRKFIRKR